MRLVPALAAAAAALCLTATAQAKEKVTVTETVELHDAHGGKVGTATLTGDPHSKGVTIKVEVEKLPPGEHAFHFHEHALCEGPDFKSAGAHFNPEHKKHGMDNPEGAHAGDMANFKVSNNGTAKVTIKNEHVTLGDGADSLFAGGGTAIVIHAKADDMKTDPSGNAGDRIACGVLKSK